MTRKLPMEERFWAKVDQSSECWIWTAHLGHDGYGQIRHDRMPVYAHRYSWELLNGPVSEGLELDHLCHNRACVNPEHLRLVTHAQNVQNRAGANSNSKTGVRGVFPTRNGYRAQYSKGGKLFHVGCYSTIAEASVAISEARRLHMTHSEMDRAS